MAKNIVICSDGTGNSAIKGRGTNVFKIFEAVDLHSSKQQQVAIYDDGVGTEKIKLWKLFTGMTGWGLSRNVKELYANLARVYQPGDRIYLFGFSRGAFTVRTLADFICSCGLPQPALEPQPAPAQQPTPPPDPSKCKNDAELLKQVEKAYTKYRSKYGSVFSILFALPIRLLGMDEPKEEAFQEVTRIAFIGVWDTVDAVGLPSDAATAILNKFYRFKFNNPALDKKVEKACHALAIDDERGTFSPVMWDEARDQGKRIEQVWFAGVHSNVGGGYPKQGMSLVSLDWMMTRAETAGLQFLKPDRERYHDHRNVNDKLYNSRSGLAVYYRYRPRNIHQICGEHNLTPKIHVSALARVAQSTDGYAPGNLPSALKIVSTDTTAPDYGDLEK